MSVLLGNICMELIQNNIWDPSGILYFPYPHKWGYWWHHFSHLYGWKWQASVCLYNKRKLHSGLQIWILFSRGENCFTHSLCLFVKYCFHHLEIKFISSHHPSIYTTPHSNGLTYLFLHFRRGTYLTCAENQAIVSSEALRWLSCTDGKASGRIQRYHRKYWNKKDSISESTLQKDWNDSPWPGLNPFTPKYKNYILPTFIKTNVSVR